MTDPDTTEPSQRSYKEGLAAQKQGHKWGFVDKSGVFVIKPEFNDVRDFNEGFAAVRRNVKWTFIDTKGKLLTDCEFVAVGGFNGGRSWVRTEQSSSLKSIDRNGRLSSIQDHSNSDWYFTGYAITWVLTFITSWIYCVVKYGFLLGVGLGWLPSAILATVVALLWPAFAVVVIVILFAIYKS